MLSVANRIKTVKEKNKLQKLIPAAIVSAKQFMDCGGLEENMFTDFSRLYMIEMLEKSGYKRIISDNSGIRLSTGPIYSDADIKSDIAVYEKLRERSHNKLNLPANFGGEWGDPEKIKYLRKIQNVPCWVNKSLLDNGIVSTEATIKITEGGKIEDEIEQYVLPVKPNKLLLGYTKPRDTLLGVKNNVKDVMIASNIIKKLYIQFGPVTLVTDKKTFPAISLINSFMIKKIFDLGDYQNGLFVAKDYMKIQRIAGFTASINLERCEYINTIDEHSPYCCNKPVGKGMPGDTICIVLSATGKGYHETDPDFWPVMNKIFKEVSSAFPHIVLTMTNERIYVTNINTTINNKDQRFFLNKYPSDTADIINNCKVIICPQESDALWISYGSKKPTVVVTNDTPEKIPVVPWLFPVNYKSEEPIENVIRHALENF